MAVTMQDILKRVQEDQPLTLLNLYQMIGCTIEANSGLANAILHIKAFEFFVTGDCLNEGQQEPTQQQLDLARAFSKALSNWSMLTGIELAANHEVVPQDYPTVDLTKDTAEAIGLAMLKAAGVRE